MEQTSEALSCKPPHRLQEEWQKHQNRCIYKEIFVCDCKDVIAVKINRDILIIELHLLHLWRSLSLSAVADAVSAEISICRPVTKISAICEEPLAVSVLL